MKQEELRIPLDSLCQAVAGALCHPRGLPGHPHHQRRALHGRMGGEGVAAADPVEDLQGRKTRSLVELAVMP